MNMAKEKEKNIFPVICIISIMLVMQINCRNMKMKKKKRMMGSIISMDFKDLA